MYDSYLLQGLKQAKNRDTDAADDATELACLCNMVSVVAIYCALVIVNVIVDHELLQVL